MPISWALLPFCWQLSRRKMANKNGSNGQRRNIDKVLRRVRQLGGDSLLLLLVLLLLLLLFLPLLTVTANELRGRWPSFSAVQSRFPGCCLASSESFDCGDGHCLSVSRFHDGVADCSDGSDEYCFPEQISCGNFCADLLHLGDCLRNPNCTQQDQDGISVPPPPFCPLLKRRLCGLSNTISCRGYGECIFLKWLKDGKRDCLDGSDEDDAYANLFKVEPIGGAKIHRTLRPPYPNAPSFTQMPLSLSVPSFIPSSSYSPSSMPSFPLFVAPMTSTGLPWRRPTMAMAGKGWRKGILMIGREEMHGTMPSSTRSTTSEEEEIGEGGLPVVESTEPGPWQNPPLDEFGTEFSRFLHIPSSSLGPLPSSSSKPTTTTSRLRTVPENVKSVEKWIIFPTDNPTTTVPKGPRMREEWPASQEAKIENHQIGHQISTARTNTQSSSTLTASRISPIMKGWTVTAIRGSNIWMSGSSTPKYPFEGGKEEEEESSWKEEKSKNKAQFGMPFPFNRPSTEWKSSRMEGRTTATMTMKRTTTPGRRTTVKEVWEPEGRGGKDENEEEEVKGKMPEEEEKGGRGEVTSAGGTHTRDGEKEAIVRTETPKTITSKLMPTAPSYSSVATASSRSSTPQSSSSSSIASSSASSLAQTSSSSLFPTSLAVSTPSSIIPSSSFKTTVPISVPPPNNMPLPIPISGLGGWALQATPQAIANYGFRDQNCTEWISRMADELAPSPRCPCPSGQMQMATDDKCVLAPVSTFRARVGSLCGQKFVDPAPSASASSPSFHEKLIILGLLSSLPDQPFCVRNVVDDDDLVVLNTVCPANNCSIDALSNATKAMSNLPEVQVKVSELPAGACHQFDLNDCDEKAECVPAGELRYECRCLPGTNDTSPEGVKGRRCEGTVIIQTCTKFLGVCVLVWLLMLLLLCFLLPILSVLCLKYCFKIHPAQLRLRLRHIWLTLIDKMKGKEPSTLPVITTSQYPPPVGQHRREGKLRTAEPGTSAQEETNTLKVPSTISPSAAHQQLARQTDSEEYLIVDEGEAAEAEEPAKEKEETERRKQQEREKEKSERVEEEGAREKERIEGRIKQQTTKQSTKSTMPSSGEGISQAEVEKSEETVKSVDETEKEAKKETEEEEIIVEEEEKKDEVGRGEAEGEEERPKSAASRVGTPTIWDQYKILGDQFSKYGSVDIEKRKGSATESLDELIKKNEMEKRKEKSVEERVEEMMAKNTEEEEEEEEEEDEKAEEEDIREEEDKPKDVKKMEKQKREEAKLDKVARRGEADEEPGRSMLPDTLPAGALNIGFALPSLADGIDIDATRKPPPPTQARFVPRPYGTRRMYEKPAAIPSKTIVESMPKGMRKGELVLVKGRMVEEEERRRKLRMMEEERRRRMRMKVEESRGRRPLVKWSREESEEGTMEGMEEGRSAMGQRRRKAFVAGIIKEQKDGVEEAGRRRPDRRRMMSKAQQSMESSDQTEEELGGRRKEAAAAAGPSNILQRTIRPPPPPPPLFDPDLPSTSEAAPYWEHSLRPRYVPRFEEYAEQRIERFRAEGRSLRSIEEQIEEKVHSGCITDRQPWDTSPRPIAEWPALSSSQRDLAHHQSDGSLAKSMEKLEERVHSGCITGRKPWDSTPYKEGKEEDKMMMMRRGHSEWDLRGDRAGRGRRKEEAEEEEEELVDVEEEAVDRRRRGIASFTSGRGRTERRVRMPDDDEEDEGRKKKKKTMEEDEDDPMRGRGRTNSSRRKKEEAEIESKKWLEYD